jgi:hypothetical protein
MELFRKYLRLQLVGELAELVGIDAWSQAEGMGDRFRRRMTAGGGDIAEPGTNRAVDGFLEGNAEFARTPLQEPSQIIVESQGRSHALHF